MKKFTSSRVSSLCISCLIIATLVSISTITSAHEPLDAALPVVALHAPAPNETAVITGPVNACVNSILTFRGNGNENNQHYVWTVDNASILYGAGTNEIQLTFSTSGTKNITLQFQDNLGNVSTIAQLTVEVADPPVFTPIATSVVCEGSVNGLTEPTVTGTYLTGTGFWSLDGVELPADYTWKYDNDYGKLLQYNVRTAGCGLVSSDGVLLTVNRIPTITSVSGLPESLSTGDTLNATVTALGNGSAISGYEWWIDDTKISTSANLTYTVSPADDGKTVKVKVFNACGADSAMHTIALKAGETITTIVNDSVRAVSPIPEGFMIQPVTTETKRDLPEKYWENPTYWFVTSPAMANYNNYVQDQVIYLERDADGIWSVSPTPSSTSYTASVQRTSSILNLGLPINAAENETANTTIVLDAGSIPMGNSIALRREGLKIFGLGALGNSIIQGQTNEPNYISAARLVIENIVFDGINFARDTHFLRIQDEGANASAPANPARRADYVILKNIAIRNVNIKGGSPLGLSPRGIFNIDDNNAYYEDGATDTPGTAVYNPSYNITERYFINITIESSCVLATGQGYPLFINSSRYDYLENFHIDITNSEFPAWIMQARDNSSEVSNSSGQVPTGITINGLTAVNDGIFVHRYQSKDITLPNDYRFLMFRTSNGAVNALAPSTGTAVTGYKTLPAAASGYAYYDRKDGYWIVRDGEARTISQQLTDLKTVYDLTVTPGTKTPLPLLHIKLIQNSGGTINGFTVPDFGEVPVHIVAVDNVDSAVDKAGTIIPYAGEATKIALTAANAPYVNLSNFDFTEHVSYYIDSVDTKIANALPGNFYHCNFLKDLYEKDSLLLLNIGLGQFAFSDISVCEPGVVDLKDLVLISGDTTGWTLKYYMNGVELTNTVISAPGISLVTIVGTTTGGHSYTTSVKVTKRTPVNIVLKFDINLCCHCDEKLNEKILEIEDPLQSIIPGTGLWILGDQAIDLSTYFLSSDDHGKMLYYQVDTECGIVRSNAIEISKCITPEINRPVRIPEVTGIETSLTPGVYYVFGHDDFVFTIAALPGYSLDYITVKTNSPVWNNEGGIKLVWLAENLLEVTLKDVTEPLDVIIEGVSPTANTAIERTPVWANGKQLFIQAEKETVLSVYTITGSLYTQQRLSAGESVLSLPPGVYIVVLDGKVYIKAAIK